MPVPTLLALVLAASQVFASPTPQGANTNGLLEKKNVHYGGCTKKLLRRPWYDILSIPSPVLGPRKGPLSRTLRLVAYNNTATHLNPPLEYYELKDN